MAVAASRCTHTGSRRRLRILGHGHLQDRRADQVHRPDHPPRSSWPGTGTVTSIGTDRGSPGTSRRSGPPARSVSCSTPSSSTSPSPPTGTVPVPITRSRHRSGCGAGQPLVQQRLAQLPPSESVQLGRVAVLQPGIVVPQHDPDPPLEQVPDRVLQEPDQFVQVEDVRVDLLLGGVGQGHGKERRGRSARRPPRSGPRRGGGGRRPGGPVPRRPWVAEVAGAVRLQGMRWVTQVVAHRIAGPVCCLDDQAVGQHVQQFADRDGRLLVLVGARVVAGVGEHEVVAGGQDGVEQQLAVLDARVRVAGSGVGGDQVEAVPDAAARNRPVVHPDQAHDAERHVAQGDQPGERDGPGAEGRSAAASTQLGGDQRPDLLQGQVDGAGRAVGR
jgi:hypothetical protein